MGSHFDSCLSGWILCQTLIISIDHQESILSAKVVMKTFMFVDFFHLQAYFRKETCNDALSIFVEVFVSDFNDNVVRFFLF